MKGCRILLTGVGPVCPVGVGREELAAAAREGLEPSELGKLRIEDYVTSAKTYLDLNSELTLAATALALRDAQVRVTEQTSASVGMSFGTRLGNIATVEAYLKMFREQGAKLASPLLFIHAYPNTSVSLSAIEWAIKGTSFNFNSGRWCGLQALIQAFDELTAGKMSVMLAGAADTYTEVTRPCAAGKPFSGASTVVLERAADAIGRGVAGLVEVAGCGMARSPQDALARALAEASVGRPELDWLLLDAPERGDDLSGGSSVTQLLPAVGDCGAATALVGVALAAVVMSEGKLPAGLPSLREPPLVAAVLSTDDTGAAAVVLRKIAG